MLKLAFTLAALTLAAQDKPEAAKPAPPKPEPMKRFQLEEADSLRLENIQLRYEAVVASICAKAGIPMPACAVDPRAGFVYERPIPSAPKAEVKK
jgi:hypothetical protein